MSNTKYQSQYYEALKRRIIKCQETNTKLLEENKKLVEQNDNLRKQKEEQREELIDIRRKMVASVQAQLDDQDLSITLLNEKIDQLNTNISDLEKNLAEKDEELEKEKNLHSLLKIEYSAQQSQIKTLEQRPTFDYTYTQVERDQQEISDQACQIERLSGEVEKNKKFFEYYKNLFENSVKKGHDRDLELNRAFKILRNVFSMLTSDSNYYGQTTLNFQNRHLPNPNLICKFEISQKDRIYKQFLSLVGPEAKIRMENICKTGEFEVNRSGQTCSVNTVIFGKTLDMDARKSDEGLSLCFTNHNPVRMHKNHSGKINHLSAG